VEKITEIPTEMYLKMIDMYLTKTYPSVMDIVTLNFKTKNGWYYIFYGDFVVMGIKKRSRRDPMCKTTYDTARLIGCIIGENDSILINALMEQWFFNRNPNFKTRESLYSYIDNKLNSLPDEWLA
jgi:hypothetical protein